MNADLKYRKQKMEQVNVRNEQQRKAKHDNFPAICSTFGCVTYLTLTEQLCGTKCLACMNTKPININNIIKTK